MAASDINSEEMGIFRITTPDQPAEQIATRIEVVALLADGDDLLVVNANGLFRVRHGQTPM